ncbi:hypothetical protein D3C87_232980 [compost metagenome]
MKAITLLLFASILAFSSKAQEWQTYYEDPGIAIQFRQVEINDAQLGIHHVRVAFRYENKTDHAIQLHFNRMITYSGDETAMQQEKTYSVSIPANSSTEYNETNSNDKTFYLFAQDKKRTIKRSLINFDIKDVTIN